MRCWAAVLTGRRYFLIESYRMRFAYRRIPKETLSDMLKTENFYHLVCGKAVKTMRWIVFYCKNIGFS